MNLNALYVAVSDMDRSIAFYENVFGLPPASRDDRFSMFKLGDALFGLFNASTEGEAVTVGNNCVANIQVEDLAAEYERLEPIVPRIDASIREAGGYRYFQFADLDGNVVELYEDRSGRS